MKVEIEVPEGKEIKEVIFIDKYEDIEWREHDKISGYFINKYSCAVHVIERPRRFIEDKYIFKTKEQANASIALAMLSQQVYEFNRGWQPNWKKEYQVKYVIVPCLEGFRVVDWGGNKPKLLTFQYKKTAEKFLSMNGEIMKEAYIFL